MPEIAVLGESQMRKPPEEQNKQSPISFEVPLLPKQQRKQYIPPDKRGGRPKAMTIALSIWSPDGIVICTNSQVTVPQYMKFSGQKIKTFWDAEKWSVAVAYSGDPERMQRICEQMRSSLYSGQNINEDFVKSSFEDALSDARSSIINPQYESIDALCCFSRPRTEQEDHAWSDKGLHVFVGKNGVVTQPTEEFTILGIGDSALSRYLENLLSAYSQCYVEYPMALVIGVYIVQQAVKYSDGCGGDMQVCILRRGHPPLPNLRKRLPMAQILQLGEALEGILQKTVVFALGADQQGIDYEKDESPETALLNKVFSLKEEMRKLEGELDVP